MGFDETKIRTIMEAGKGGKYSLGTADRAGISVIADNEGLAGLNLNFEPSPSYKGHIERD